MLAMLIRLQFLYKQGEAYDVLLKNKLCPNGFSDACLVMTLKAEYPSSECLGFAYGSLKCMQIAPYVLQMGQETSVTSDIAVGENESSFAKIMTTSSKASAWLA